MLLFSSITRHKLSCQPHGQKSLPLWPPCDHPRDLLQGPQGLRHLPSFPTSPHPTRRISTVKHFQPAQKCVGLPWCLENHLPNCIPVQPKRDSCTGILCFPGSCTVIHAQQRWIMAETCNITMFGQNKNKQQGAVFDTLECWSLTELQDCLGWAHNDLLCVKLLDFICESQLKI